MWRLKVLHFLLRTPLSGIIKKVIYWKWRFAGSPIPPPYTVKREEIKKIAQEFKCKIFVETGTFLGLTTDAMRKCFKQLYTIELSDKLFLRAQNKFSKYQHIKVLHGDSGIVLFDIIKQIDKKVLFWLDGHYSGGETAKGATACPIFKELEAIFMLKNIEYVLMIDDARCFGDLAYSEYPSIESLIKYVNQNSPLKMAHEVKLDIIMFKPIK
jgi:hypothetical protein